MVANNLERLLVLPGSLHFRDQHDSPSGLFRHCGVFHHPNLVRLTIKNHTENGYTPNVRPMPFSRIVERVTPLRELEVDGVNLRTLLPALRCPRQLEILSIVFKQNRRHDFEPQDGGGLFMTAFSTLLPSLISLEFNHSYLSNLTY